MQRASATSTPSSEPGSKRRKVNSSSQSSPGTPSSSAYADQSAVSTALKAEADAQAIARARNAREGGETEWVLDLNLPAISDNDRRYGDINPHHRSGEESDSDLSELWTNQATGRQTYGGFKRNKKHVKSTTIAEPGDEMLSSASDSDVSNEARALPQMPSSKKKRKHEADEERRLDNIDIAKMAKSSAGGLGRDRTGGNRGPQPFGAHKQHGRSNANAGKERKKYRKTL